MEEKKFHYSWIIFISCCCMFAGGIALADGICGIYIVPVSDALGVGRGDFAFYLTIEGIVTAVSSPIWARLLETKNFNVVMGAGTLMFGLGILGFGVATKLWQFYALAVLIGLGMAIVYMLAVPMLITNWFSAKKRGKMLGFACAFSGMGVFVWSPVLTSLITNYGYQTAYLVNGALALVLCFIPAAFLVKRRPEDKGLLPYGYKPGDEEERKAAEAGAAVKTALKSPAFWMIILATLCVCMGMGYASAFPGIALERFVPGLMDENGAAMIGATAISVAAIANLLGKIFFGFLNDKFGSLAAWIVFLCMSLASFFGFLIAGNTAVFLIAAFLLGTHNALMAVSFPLLTREIFGGKNFARIWSYICVPFGAWSCFSASVVGWIFDGTGSYNGALWLGVGIFAAVFVFIIVAHKFIGKVEFEPADEEAVA